MTTLFCFYVNLSFNYFSFNILFDKIIFKALPRRNFIVLNVDKLIIKRRNVKNIDNIGFANPGENSFR